MQTGTVSRLWLRRRSWRFKIQFWRNIVRFWKSYICSNKLDVRNKLQFHKVQQNQKSFISLDDGLRLNGIPALDLWDLIVLVLGSTTQNHDRTVKPVVCRDKKHAEGQQCRGTFNVLKNFDRVPSNVQFSHQEAVLYVFEDNEAVIKIIITGRSPQWDMFPQPTELP